MITCLLLAALAASCTSEQRPRRMPTKRDLVELNRRFAQRDSALIVAYSDSLGLNPKPDRSGLWLTVFAEGEGQQIRNGQTVEYAYTISDLRGETYYTSQADGNQTIIVGSGQNASGLDETLLHLRRGARATAILLPDKAFGMVGDENKITGRKILRYDVEILSVE